MEAGQLPTRIRVNGRAATGAATSSGFQWSDLEAAAWGSAPAPPTTQLVPYSELLGAYLVTPPPRQEIPLPRALGSRLPRPLQALLEAIFPPAPSALAASGPVLALYTLARSESLNPSAWHPRLLLVECAGAALARQWLLQLHGGIAAAAGTRPRRLVVLLSPSAGSGRAEAVLRRVVLPVWRVAGVQATVLRTRRAGDVELVVRRLAAVGERRERGGRNDRGGDGCGVAGGPFLSQPSTPPTPASPPAPHPLGDGLVVVGGDGAFHELLNAVLNVPGAAARMKSGKLRLAHIPAGSTDAVACSLQGCRSAFTAAAHVALGDCARLDVVRVEMGAEQRGRELRVMENAGPRDASFSVQVIGDEQPAQVSSSSPREGSTYVCCIAATGFMGRVCVESERWRWLGPVRYDLAGVAALCFGQPVLLEIAFLPAPLTGAASEEHPCFVGCAVCAGPEEISRILLPASANPSLPASANPLLPASTNPSLPAPTNLSLPASTNLSLPASSPPSSAPQRPQWRRLPPTAYSSAILISSPCRSEKTPAGMARFGHLADGRLTLALVPASTGRLGLLRFLHAMARDGAAPARGPPAQGAVEEPLVLPVSAVTVDSSVPVPWNLDGEARWSRQLTATVLRGEARVFARGVEFKAP